MIDYRSDTVTKPTPEMISFMQRAEVGDDVYGEDSTVNTLEKEVASLFGHEAALYCPSGTMTNQIAIKTHTQPGDEVICHAYSHIYQYEGGGLAFNSGVQSNLIHTSRGVFAPNNVEERIRPDDVHFPRTSLVSIENTCNKGGGTCWELEEIEAIQSVCRAHHLKLHLDGARVFNAIAAKNYIPQELGTKFDSISVCFSKGLGAPVGSALIGSTDFIKQAKRWRKVMGGGMRQAGFIAAGAIYALRNHRERLQEDHRRMELLINGLKDLSFVEGYQTPETNIGIVHFSDAQTVDQVLSHLKSNDILTSAMGPKTIRFVTHLHHTDQDIERTIDTLTRFA
jgi:threonine aldolase